jgi:lysophospholipase L1-like esterase
MVPLAGVMFSQNPQFGFWNRPNLRAKRFQSEPNTPFYRVTTDAKGYRGLRPVQTPKPQGVRRVVVLGDSFTFGVGVDDKDTFPAQLERELNRTAAKGTDGAARCEVVNAGCPGWGTENELAFWRARSKELQPDLLVVAFFRNDLADNMRHFLFQVTPEGKAVYKPNVELSRAKQIAEKIPFYGFLSEHSHLLNLLRRIVAKRVMGSMPQKTAGRSESEKGPSSAKEKVAEEMHEQAQASRELREQLRVYQVLMEALLSDARSQGVPVVLLPLPGRMDCEGDPTPETSEALRLGEEWVRQGKAARLVNVRESIRQAHLQHARSSSSPGIFIPGDGHYLTAGNRIVAENLSPILLGAPKIIQ